MSELLSAENLQYFMLLCGALGAAYGVWKWLWPAIVRLTQWLVGMRDTLEGLPETLASVTGMKEQLGVVAATTARIQQMVLPNGGSSLPDKMDQLRRAFDAMGKEVTGLANLQKAAQNTNTRMASFTAGLDGRITDASKTYARWTGMQIQDLHGWGWVNTVHPEELQSVRAQYVSAIADRRACVIEYSMIGHDGIARAVELSLTPVPDNGNCESFFGSILVVEDADA